MKLIFVHGSGCTKDVWYYQTKCFTDSEAINLPGHLGGDPCTSVDDYVDWLRECIRQKGYRDIVLAGHSLGGAIVLLYALKYPEDLKAIILVGTGARLRVHPDYLSTCEQGIEDQESWLKGFVEPQYARIDPDLKGFLIRKHQDVGAAVQLNDLLCCDKFDVMDRVKGIKLPTLSICGTEDEMTSVKYTQFFTKNIEGAKEKIIDGAGHFVFLDRPGEVNQAIEKFINSL